MLCEKPLAMDLTRALEIERAVRKAGVTFMLAVPGRFGAKNMLLRQIQEDGKFGEIYFAKTAYVRRRGTPSGWFTDKKTAGGGPVIDIGIHGIDAAWYIMGEPKPVRVSAAVSNRIGDYQTRGVSRWVGTPCPDNRFDVEDSGAGVIHFENGAILLFEASWAINGPEHSETLLCGTKAGASLEPLRIYGETEGYLSDNAVNAGTDDRFLAEITHFADCVLHGRKPKYPIEQAVLMQRMLQGIYASAARGAEVTL